MEDQRLEFWRPEYGGPEARVRRPEDEGPEVRVLRPENGGPEARVVETGGWRTRG